QSDLAFTAAGLQRDVAFEAMAADLITGLVRQNLAIALLPSAFTPALPDLVTIPVDDGPTRVEYLAWSDFNPSPAASAFLDVLPRDTAPSPEPPRSGALSRRRAIRR